MAKTKKAKKTSKIDKKVNKTENKLPVKTVAEKKLATKPAKKIKEKAESKAKAAKKEKAVKAEELIDYSKHDLIEKFAQKAGDTGSPEVQVAIATQKIFKLTKHLDENPKDNHSRRGLLKIIAKRRRLLSYLQDKDNDRYKHLTVELGLKK